jgi:hypothetical protein
MIAADIRYCMPSRRWSSPKPERKARLKAAARARSQPAAAVRLPGVDRRRVRVPREGEGEAGAQRRLVRAVAAGEWRDTMRPATRSVPRAFAAYNAEQTLPQYLGGARTPGQCLTMC